MGPGADMQSNEKLKEILSFLDQDPSNCSLLMDAATQAFGANDFDLTDQLIQRYADLKPLPANLVNLQGLIAISQKRYDDAARIMAGLRAAGIDDPALRFNLAWAWAMEGHWEKAADLLDDESMATSSLGPVLKIQMLHHLGKLDEALACGEALCERYPQDQALMGALASVATDAERSELALGYAKRAGDNAEGLAALGILALNNQDTPGSLEVFDEALQKDPNNARALVGKGLGLLSSGDMAGGITALDRGAQLFRTHIGSWVAAGWAHFTVGDYPAARARFENAMALDPNFSETHGGIAVINIVEGKWEDAARECDIALRLDRDCFGAALAKSLLLQHRGHPQMAQKIIDTAMSSPVGPNGETLKKMLTSFGGGLRR
jgi:tetratricopeptide (TPR) repeat protein